MTDLTPQAVAALADAIKVANGSSSSGWFADQARAFAIRDLQEAAPSMAALIAAQAAEIERLWAALHKIGTDYDRLRVALHKIGRENCEYTTGEGHSDAIWTARQALEGAKP